MELLQKKKNNKNFLEWEVFKPYDIKSAEKRLNPEEKAHEFATSDSKTAVNDDTQLTSPEIEIIADVNDHILQLSDWHTHATGEAKDVVIALTDDIDPDFNFRKIKETFKKNVNHTLAAFKFDLDKIYTPLKNTYRRMNAFQLKHCIEHHRAAEYPESKLLHFAILFLVLFIESIANCLFFAKGSVYGYFGGLTEAIVISLANITVAFFAGAFFLRQFNYVERKMKVSAYIRKYSAIAGFAVCLFSLGFLHLGAAHYRELILRSSGYGIQKTIETLKHLVADPFALQDLESLILIILGCGISAVGIWKGYTFDDRFPRYGKVFRTWKELDDNMAVLYESPSKRL